MNEREIVFVNLVKGLSKKSNENYYRIDYIRKDNWSLHSDFITAIEYEKIKKKVSDKHLYDCVGVLSLNDYDRVYVSDIK